MHQIVEVTLSGGVNQEGIDHYSNLIDELLKNGEKLWIFEVSYFLHLHLCASLTFFFFFSKCRNQALCFTFALWLATRPGRQVYEPLMSLVYVWTVPLSLYMDICIHNWTKLYNINVHLDELIFINFLLLKLCKNITISWKIDINFEKL